MKIIVRKPYKAINPFEEDNLPDLVVLTGENGTGKTQLLQYLFRSTQEDAKGELLSLDEEEENNADEYLINEQEMSDEDDFHLPFAELCDGQRSFTDIVFREVQAPNVEVGGKYDIKTLFNEGRAIAQKHLFYNTHFVESEKIDDEEKLTSSFQKTVGLRKGARISPDTVLPGITKQDLEIIKRIEIEYSNKDYTKDPYFYIAFQPIPKSTVFTTNLRFLYFQYWARIQAGLSVGDAPWVVFNRMGERLNFKFELDEPRIEDKKFDVRLRDKGRKVFISPESLSSGEKVIFSLFVAMYSTNTNSYLPDVILLDEPDAFLHPSLSRTMLEVIQEIFIGQYNIKVIITTHSPTTVALTPEQSLYRMSNGKMIKTTKKDAILALTSGLNTISVYYENVKQIFVEANNDNCYLSYVTHYATEQKILLDEVHLRFVNVGNNENGGCDVVKKVVHDLADANNNTIYGIVDWDGKNNDQDRVFVLGNGNRYAIDNYLLDPLVIILLCMEEEPKWRTLIGLEDLNTIVTFSNINPQKRQEVINNIVTIIEQTIPFEERTDTSVVSYQTMGGQTYKVPQWYMYIKGHNLVAYVKNAFPFMNKFHSDDKLFHHVVETLYASYPDIIPMDVVETLKKIQEYQ